MAEATSPPSPPPPAPSASGLGLKPNTAALLCYLFGVLSGLFFFLTEKNDKYVRFHALQSILLSVVIFSVDMVLTVVGLGLLGSLVNLVWLGATVLMMVKAYQGQKYKLPVIGDFAEKNA